MSTGLPPERAERIRSLFRQLVELTAGRRALKLDEIRETDPGLSRELLGLLEADEQAEEALQRLDRQFPWLVLPAAEQPDPLVGRCLSHYAIQEKLGGGAMGVVYKARDLRLDRTVALKFLPPHLNLDDEAKQRLILEARAASTLDHPNICTIYDIDETPASEGAGRQLFIAMAYYPGETLKKKVEGGPLPVREVLDYAAQVAEGLKRAHEAGIVHRDIKPANVLVTERGQVKLVDFGIAKAQGTTLTRPGLTLGTVAYMSPEQTRGGAVDRRTDLWSLGVVLYEMLTGRQPFRGENELGVLYSITHEEPESLRVLRPEVPEPVSRLVEKLLRKEPTERYGSAEEVLWDLRAIDEAPARSGLVASSRRSGSLLAGRAGRAVLLLPLTALGWFLWQEAVDRKNASLAAGIESLAGAPEVSLAILPLRNVSGDPEKEYFADGITERLITELSRVRTLRVIPRTSVMRYKHTDKPLPTIARELGATAIVEGSAMPIGDRVRITINLVDARAERPLWAEIYERPMQDVLKVQREVTLDIARKVNARVDLQQPAQPVRVVDPEAYDLYLRGRYLKHQEGRAGAWDQALASFQESVAIDSSFAPAWAGLAMLYALQAFSAYPEVAAPARRAAQKALVLDPRLSDGHVSLALVHQFLDWDWQAAEGAFRRAIELDPGNWEAHYEYGLLLIRLARHEEALAAMRRALELEPLSATAHHGMTYAHIFARRYEEAIETARQALDVEPNSALLWGGYARALGLAGRTAEEDRAQRKFYALCCDVSEAQYEELPEVRFRRHLASGERSRALEVLRHIEILRDVQRADVTRFNELYLAEFYLELGDREQALRWLERGVERRQAAMSLIKVRPFLDPLRGEPRFQELLKKMGLDG